MNTNKKKIVVVVAKKSHFKAKLWNYSAMQCTGAKKDIDIFRLDLLGSC